MAVVSGGTTLINNGALDSGVSTGALILIKSITVSGSASVSFVDGTDGVVLDDTYDTYVFKFISIHPSVDGVTFSFQGSTNTGSSYGVTTTSTYFNSYHSEGGASALNYESVADVAQGTGEIALIREDKLSADADHSGNGILTLYNPSSTTFVKHYISRTQANHEAEYSMDSYIGGYFNTTSAIDAIRFSVNSGNIAEGIIKLYGIKG